eukprot:1158199-Pelagomonas_calceolata.AAC.12
MPHDAAYDSGEGNLPSTSTGNLTLWQGVFGRSDLKPFDSLAAWAAPSLSRPQSAADDTPRSLPGATSFYLSQCKELKRVHHRTHCLPESMLHDTTCCVCPRTRPGCHCLLTLKSASPVTRKQQAGRPQQVGRYKQIGKHARAGGALRAGRLVCEAINREASVWEDPVCAPLSCAAGGDLSLRQSAAKGDPNARALTDVRGSQQGAEGTLTAPQSQDLQQDPARVLHQDWKARAAARGYKLEDSWARHSGDGSGWSADASQSGSKGVVVGRADAGRQVRACWAAGVRVGGAFRV